MPHKFFDWMFREDETLHPRIVVSAGLFAYFVLFLRPVLGLLFFPLVPGVVVALGLVCYAALRILMPVMDPAHPGADRFVVYGSTVLFVAIGAQAFGFWFLPGLAGGVAIIIWRAPELLDSLPKLPNRTTQEES